MSARDVGVAFAAVAFAAVAFAAAGVGAAGCIDPEYGSVEFPLEAACVVDITGVGARDVETDYLPSVINCENGAASFEALKAQAITARSYLYYRLGTTGEISDGTGDQVYTCGRQPGPDHARAATETSGQVLRYLGTQVAAFYVAGALQDQPECIGGTDDPTDTEKWVTYNDGLAGDSIVQTMLGFVDPDNHANRGCMSQNGSDCMADRGDDVETILRFYYGDDIEIETAEGPCVLGGGGGADAGPDPDPSPDIEGGCACQSGGSPGGLSFALFALLALFALPGLSRRRRTNRV